MFDRFLTDFSKTRPLCNNRNVTVHLTINFNILYNIFTVSFQATIKIMQVANS